MKLNNMLKVGAVAVTVTVFLSGCVGSVQNLGKSSNFQEAKKAHT